MAAATIVTGIRAPASPATRRAPARATMPCRRMTPITYRRRRLAVVVMALGVVVGAAQAGVALGSSKPLEAPERRPAVFSAQGQPAQEQPLQKELDPGGIQVIVRPGDTLWSIATRLAPNEDPRPLVDAVSKARRGAPLVPGEAISWPS